MEHVFENIQELEDQANEELSLSISYSKWPAPFDMRRKKEEVQYDHERDMYEEYVPVIQQAVGIRFFQNEDSAEDVALAEKNSLKWYHAAIRPKPDLFTIIKYRSPSPCPSLIVQLAGLADAHAWQRYEGDPYFDVLIPCGTAETADVSDVEPQESAAVANRLWDLAIRRGGSTVMLSAKEGGRKRFSSVSQEDLDTEEPWIRMPEDALDRLWSSEVNPAASLLETERAASSTEAGRQRARGKRRRG